MGLDTTHDAFHGAYSAFNRFRKVVAQAMGGSYSPHEDKTLDDDMWYFGEGFSRETHPGLYLFLCHSDCDGEFTPDECILVANDLESLLPEIKQIDDTIESWGHILSNGGFIGTTEKFIKGCRAAAEANQPLEFW